ncbi:MAG: restriction endonuclease subunit S [Acutalibacteraceae bacterium]
MTNKNRFPAIRFKGFDDAWEQRKAGDVVKEVTRNDPTSEAPIMMITANNGFIEQSERYAFNNAGESLKKYILLEKGELAYNHGASKLRPYGSCFALTTAEKARIPFVYHCFSAEEQNAEFMSIELNGSDVENQLRRIVSSGARMDGLLNISFAEYASVLVLLPKIEEQNRIADFFRNLDHLITLHQRKLDKLHNIKKACLEKMFPKNGSNVPEIRFAGFTEAWEQRKVSELFRVTRGYVLATTQTDTTKTDEKPYPVYSSQTKDKGLMGYYKDYLYEDAITWTTDGANAGTVNYRAGKFYCTNVCGVLLSNEVKANQMIAEALNNVAKGYVSYVGNPKLMNNVMADIVIQIPTQSEERELLSSLFASFDNLITLHQRKCFLSI